MEQAVFWSEKFGDSYTIRNSPFDNELEIRAWEKMINSADKAQIESVLECGCNWGRNLLTLKKILPGVHPSLIELNKKAYEKAIGNVSPLNSFNGQIVDSEFLDNSFDLVFTCGVLIHIAPYDLYKNLEKMYNYSNKYILISEYFSRTFEMKPYHGELNKLFKMDFGGYFMDNFDVKLLEYGFLWGREFDKGGFDDETWWLFEKK